MAQLGIKYTNEIVQSSIARYLPGALRGPCLPYALRERQTVALVCDVLLCRPRVTGAAALWTGLRYYFDVNNSYVKNKLRVRVCLAQRAFTDLWVACAVALFATAMGAIWSVGRATNFTDTRISLKQRGYVACSLA